jgi:glycosyltransferase involved in cell wall biosynthesis
MKKKKIIITVIVTTHNSNLEYLDECLTSIVLQSYKYLEIIIVDDFSKKEIYKIQKKYIQGKFKKKFKFLRNKKNYGVAYSLNRAIKISKGRYINWCSDDDYLHVDKIEKQYQKIKNLKNTVISCNTFVKYQELNFIRKQNYNFLNNKDALISLDKFSGGSFLIPKLLFYQHGYFKESLRYVQDYEMWLRWNDNNVKFRNVNNYLFYMRIHIEQGTQKNNKKAIAEKNFFYLNYFKDNIDYFLNSFSESKILLIVNRFYYRNLPSVSKFVTVKFFKYILQKKGNFIFFIIKFLFTLSFVYTKIISHLISGCKIIIVKQYEILK